MIGAATAIDDARTAARPFAQLLRYRELIWTLAWRDIHVRYKHSMLGAAWAVLPPVAMMLVFNFVFGAVADIDRQKLTGHANVPYCLFAFCGLVPWMFLANGLTAATTSLVANRQLVTKVYFPRAVLPLASIGSALIDFLIAGAILVLLTGYYHFTSDAWRFEWHPSILLLPLVVVVQIVFMCGVGLLLSMANLFYRDVGFLFRALVQLWMFLTCVVYQLDAGGGWKRLVIQLNPLTPIIRAYRDCLLFGRLPLDASFTGAAAISFLLLFLGWRWFRSREMEFAEYI
ncbi:MAG TPA: ABC transporter permease [Phycisphaerae bacterium]|nr:ABC transporter permease [Phycisphaerae bacterium]